MKYRRTVQVTINYTIGADTKKGLSAMMTEIAETIPASRTDSSDDGDGCGFTVIDVDSPSRKKWKIKDLK